MRNARPAHLGKSFDTCAEMKSFRVRLEGRHVDVQINGVRALRGFITIRGVEATSPEAAVSRALEDARAELAENLDLAVSELPEIQILGIDEVDPHTRRLIPKSGFTWYREEAH